jgi:2-amino-4-hydroxy-6-hydroxymethyldihydropteridine diphosphokinase
VSSRAFLGVGSNLGDRLKNLGAAAELLGAEAGVHVVASARVWETDPVGGPPQPQFLNTVLEIDTDLEPRGLLEACHRVEAVLQRERTTRWGPRTIDIDILAFGTGSVDEPDLIIPHPRARGRAFVVLPWLELAPDLVLPDGSALVASQVSGDAWPFAPPLRIADPE